MELIKTKTQNGGFIQNCWNFFFWENATNAKKKCVAYPQEDFLFTILYGDPWRPPKKYIYYLKSEKTKTPLESIR
jgi:hypothetical protein